MSDIGFSGAQLTLLGVVFAPLLTTIGVLFRSLLASKDQQIKLGVEALEEALTTNKELAKAVAEATAELRELRSDLWRTKAVGKGREGSI